METSQPKTDSEDLYKKIFNERKQHVDSILSSSSKKKVVVAGPGTGKTYLFKEALAGKSNTLTLTFVNSLVEDLSLELHGISDVKTLHGFSRSVLGQILKQEIKIFPKFSKIIKEDAEILIEKTIDFDSIFYNRDDLNEYLVFHETRRKYYDYYGYSDIVFATVKILESDNTKIPKFELVVVDEFQDFNKLEVSLIELLSKKNSILLAGDDDQALYEFKSASSDYIRERYSEKRPEYESFSLPFCARCTQVIVEATNDLTSRAQENKLLNGRINKPFKYFQDKEKDKVSAKFSKVIYAQKYDGQIAWFIEKSLDELAKDLKSSFSVLIISPYKKHCHKITEALKNKGLQNIEFTENPESQNLSLIDGLRILMTNDDDNLGWRIAAKFLSSSKEFISALKATESDASKKFIGYLGADIKDEIKKILRILKRVRDNKPFDMTEFKDVLDKLQIDPYQLSSDFINEKLISTSQRTGIPAIRKIPIKATTIQSSKGLSADIVFITHFDDQYFIKDKDKTKITDQDLCNFLVALTRTKKKAFLISTQNKFPTFLNWIDKERIQIVR